MQAGSGQPGRSRFGAVGEEHRGHHDDRNRTRRVRRRRGHRQRVGGPLRAERDRRIDLRPGPGDRTQGGRGARQRRARVRAPVRRRTSGPRGVPDRREHRRRGRRRRLHPGERTRSGSGSSAPSSPRSTAAAQTDTVIASSTFGTPAERHAARPRTTPSGCWSGTRSIPSTCSLSSKSWAGVPRLAVNGRTSEPRCTHPSA